MKNRIRRIAFVSQHCVLDFTNGAATATLDGLSLLARSGFECQAFCNSRMDASEEVLVEEILAKRGLRYVVRNTHIGPYRGRMIFTSYEKIPVTLFNSASTRGGWINREEVAAFLTACEIFLTKNRPDVVWTYGGGPVAIAIQQAAKKRGIPILFALHNFNYRSPRVFRIVDRVIVPSQFSRTYYRQSLGLACHWLPYVIDRGRVSVERYPERTRRAPCDATHHAERADYVGGPGPLPAGDGRFSPRFLTFVNPQSTKGLYFFARLAEMLAARRPQIPLLLIEGRNAPNWKEETGINLAGLPNLTVRPKTTDPRKFYAITKLLVVPSLWNESFGLVAGEAMTNGIPVLASNRGALPETIGDAGFLFDIPARYTRDTRDVPTAEEVEPWVETIIRLWDDAAEYERWSRAARDRAQQWHPDRLAPIYCEFFSSITHQPGPPLVPRGVGV